MERLSFYFQNPFLDTRISVDNFKKFSEDHLARLAANAQLPGTKVDALVAPTGAAHLAFFGNITDVSVASAVQQGMTVAVDAAMKAFKDLVKKEASGIEYALGGKTAAAYQEFFPHGLTEYSLAGRANVEQLMLQFKAAAAKNEPIVKPGLGATVERIHGEYQALREAQLGKKGTVSDERATRDQDRARLAAQLWKNLRTISLAFDDNPAAGMAFFDESIIRKERDNGRDAAA